MADCENCVHYDVCNKLENEIFGGFRFCGYFKNKNQFLNIGDKIYQHDAERIYESTIKNIVYETTGIIFDERAIDKTVFLTREEAERALYIDSDYCGAVDKALIQSAINSINRLQARVIKEQNKNSKLRNERNHLQAEIERLKECPKCVYEYDGEMTEYCVQGPCPNFKTVEQIKAEAYKEFAERLKEYAYLDNGITGFQDMVVDLSDIENIADEMAGEDNAKEKE